MALFDTVVIHPSLLPEDTPAWLKGESFQTYDLGKGMSDYAFQEDGTFVMDRHLLAGIIGEAFKADPETFPAVPINYKRKKLRLWAYSNQDGVTRTADVVVQIRNGKFSSFKITHQTTEDRNKK